MAKINVTTPFRLLSWSTDPPSGYTRNTNNMKLFAAAGVYAVFSDVPNIPYVLNFATVVADNTTATQTYSVIDS